MNLSAPVAEAPMPDRGHTSDPRGREVPTIGAPPGPTKIRGPAAQGTPLPPQRPDAPTAPRTARPAAARPAADDPAGGGQDQQTKPKAKPSARAENPRDDKTSGEQVDTKPPTGTDTRPKDPEPALADASADVLHCERTTQVALDCCANPDSCLSSSERSLIDNESSQALSGGGSGGGLNSLSLASSSSNSAASNINATYGKACFRSKATCNDSCASAASKYQSLRANCSGCASSSIYDDALTRISSSQNTCSRVSASKFSEQSLANSAGMGQANAANQSSEQTKKAAADAASGCQPANSPQCLAQQAQARAAAATSEQGQAGFQTASKSRGKFNLGDNADQMMQSPYYAGGPSREDNKNAPQVKTIANNSGGGIPGQGASPNGAKLDGAKKMAGAPSAASNVTDIEQGMRSGGYSQPVGPNNDSGASYGGLGRALASQGGIDLRQYLPGGRRDPTANRGIGGNRPPGTQIHGKHVDMWARITDRMQEKCRIGELFGCG